MSHPVVCMPWRSQPSRTAAFERVCRFWHHMGYPVFACDSGPGPFNRSRARNRAVRHANTDLLILADADTLPEPDPVREAVDTIGDEAVWPFDRFRLIGAEWLDRADLSGAPAVHGEEWQYGDVTGGVIVVSTQSYWRAGGFDERFEGWGGEDTAFRCAANTLIGGRRIPGLLLGFNHQAARESGRANITLKARYKAADLHPLAMLRLIEGNPAYAFMQMAKRRFGERHDG